MTKGEVMRTPNDAGAPRTRDWPAKQNGATVSEEFADEQTVSEFDDLEAHIKKLRPRRTWT